MKADKDVDIDIFEDGSNLKVKECIKVVIATLKSRKVTT